MGRIIGGFAVGVEDGHGTVIDGKTITPQDILDFIDSHQELLNKPNNFIGTWYDEQTQKTYIDVSTAVATEQEAHKLGRANNQYEIFDLKRDE